MIGVEDDSVIIATWNSEMRMGVNFLRKVVRDRRRAEMEREQINYLCLQVVM